MHVFLSNLCCQKFILYLGSAAAPVPAAHGAKLLGGGGFSRPQYARDKALDGRLKGLMRRL